MKKRLVCIVLLFHFLLPVYSIMIGVTDLYLTRAEADKESRQDTSLTGELFAFIKEASVSERLQFTHIKGWKNIEGQRARSILDAEELAYMYNISYVLYGEVKLTGDYFDAQLKLFNNENKQVVKVIYAKHSRDDREGFIRDLGEKLLAELVELFKITANELEKKTDANIFDYIGVAGGAGYWIPMGDWWDVVTGAMTVGTGMYVGFVPVAHIKEHVKLRLRTGFFVTYSFGLNKPGLVESYFNSFLLTFPFAVSFDFYERYWIYLETGPQVQIDFIAQRESYREDYYQAAVAFSLSVAPGFEIFVDPKKKWAVGHKSVFNFSLYNTFFADYKPQIYFMHKINLRKEDRKSRGIKNESE